jgi:8-oxo-dGTP pyrophosphatase MutT (NUDIX family)
MAFSDTYRLSAHAVITDDRGRALLLRQSYGDGRWGLPGGSPEKGETMEAALVRECKEELGLDVAIRCLTGVYYHSEFDSHVFIFGCGPIDAASIRLSEEHTEHRFFDLRELGEIQRRRIADCLSYEGTVRFRKF